MQLYLRFTLMVLIGVAIAGRPLARLLDDGFTLEITRVCSKPEFKNLNSFLYGRVKRLAQLFGYKTLITYTLQEESGSSLRGSGFEIDALIKQRFHSWNKRNDHLKREYQEVYSKAKIRWIKLL